VKWGGGGMDGFKGPQEGGGGGTLVVAVMNLGVPQNVGNFLTS